VTRTVLLGLLGLVLAVAVGFGVHLVTRSTIALPVVQLEPPQAPATTAATTATTTGRTAGERTTTEADAPVTAGPPVSTEDSVTRTETETETDDDGSGRGRGRGRSGGDGGGDNSGSGGGDGDDD
jgi:uncharacterized membrane protein YgcG